jgi:hypothetical protein
MHLVVAARVPSPPEAASASLVALLGLSLYEARARLQAPAPRLLAVMASGDEAASLVGGLNAAGFMALRVPGERIETDRGRDHIASLSFGPEALEATLRDGRTREIPWSSVRLLLRGTRSSQHVTVREETSSRFSAGRAMLSGGLITQTKVTTTTKVTDTTRQGFLYILDDAGSPALALYEQRTAYAFLGALLQPSSVANFSTVLDLLRKRAPRARFDDRLIRAANLGAIPPPPPGVDPEEWKVDVGCAMLSAADEATH